MLRDCTDRQKYCSVYQTDNGIITSTCAVASVWESCPSSWYPWPKGTCTNKKLNTEFIHKYTYASLLWRRKYYYVNSLSSTLIEGSSDIKKPKLSLIKLNPIWYFCCTFTFNHIWHNSIIQGFNTLRLRMAKGRLETVSCMLRRKPQSRRE